MKSFQKIEKQTKLELFCRDQAKVGVNVDEFQISRVMSWKKFRYL